MFNNLQFSRRLSIYIILATSIVFISIFSYNYFQSKKVIEELSLDKAQSLTIATTEKIERILQNVEQVPLYLAKSLSEETFTKNQIEKALIQFLKSNPNVYGATIAFYPWAFDDNLQYYAPYYHKNGRSIQKSNLADDNYQYWKHNWYLKPQQEGKALWSEPYFDKGAGNALMATFSVPVYKNDAQGNQQFFAIVTADIHIGWLQELVNNIKIYDTGYAFILSRDGNLIVHRNKKFNAKSDRTIYHIAKKYHVPWLESLAKKMTQGKQGMIEVNSMQDDENLKVIYNVLPSSGWSLALCVPTAEIYFKLHQQTFIVVLLTIIGILGITLLVNVVAHRATKPLRKLSHSTEEIAQGKLDTDLPRVKTLDEIGQLTTAFDLMRNSLREYITSLTQTTAAKERIESELKIAQSIQASFLPKKFPPFPKYQEFDIFAKLVPAREIGGDFYDFFILNEELLFFSIGDVSGKGVPAALVMAVTKTLIKGIAEHEQSPANVLRSVNTELAKDNENCMFVTVFCGILNIHSGELTYTNAGHNAPILLCKSNNSIKHLELPKGIALGIVEGAQYVNKTINLLPDDTILLYTDGVSEAMSPNQQQFGEDRLLKTLNCEKSAHCIVQDVYSSVVEHTADAEQFDDITLMTLFWKGHQ